MATSDSPLSVPDVTLAVARKSISVGNGVITVTGSGFGPAPNVVQFRTFAEGAAGNQIQTSAPSGEVGDFDFVTPNAKYLDFGGRKVFAGFDAGVKQSCTFVNGASFTRFRQFVTLAVPDSGVFPGNAGTGLQTFPTDSGMKAAWLMLSDNGNNREIGEADIVLPTHTGSGRLRAQGNSVDPSFFMYNGTGDDFWAWNEFNSFGFVCPADLNNPKTVAVDLELFMTSSKVGTVVRTKNIAAFTGTDSSVTDANAAYDRVKYNAYALDAGGNAQIYYSDMYLAVESFPGANDFVQCAFLGNAAAFADCTELRPVKAQSWSDTEVTIPNPYGLPYYHIVKPDGSIVSGAPI